MIAFIDEAFYILTGFWTLCVYFLLCWLVWVVVCILGDAFVKNRKKILNMIDFISATRFIYK